jgi:hypothetical protein
MNLTLSVSMARATIILLSWAFIAVLVSFSWSPYGVLLLFLGVPAALSMYFRRENVSLDEAGSLSVRGVLIKNYEVFYIYEDPGCIVIRTIDSSRKFMFLGFCSIRPRTIYFKKFYIKNSNELSRVIENIPAVRRDFMFQRLLYYFSPF